MAKDYKKVICDLRRALHSLDKFYCMENVGVAIKDIGPFKPIYETEKGGNTMPKKDLTNKYNLNDVVYLYDDDGKRVKGRIDRIYQKYGTVIYEIDGTYDDYSAAAITTYHRAESALENEEPHTTSINEPEASFRYLGDEIDLGNLNITLDPLDDEMMKKFDNLAEKRIKYLEEDVRKEIRDIVLRVLEEKELI